MNNIFVSVPFLHSASVAPFGLMTVNWTSFTPKVIVMSVCHCEITISISFRAMWYISSKPSLPWSVLLGTCVWSLTMMRQAIPQLCGALIHVHGPRLQPRLRQSHRLFCLKRSLHLPWPPWRQKSTRILVCLRARRQNQQQLPSKDLAQTPIPGRLQVPDQLYPAHNPSRWIDAQFKSDAAFIFLSVYIVRRSSQFLSSQTSRPFLMNSSKIRVWWFKRFLFQYKTKPKVICPRSYNHT